MSLLQFVRLNNYLQQGEDMKEDDILLEIRRTREAFAEAHGFDIRAMVATLRRMDDAGDWPVVSLRSKQNPVVNPSDHHLTPSQTPVVGTAGV